MIVFDSHCLPVLTAVDYDQLYVLWMYQLHVTRGKRDRDRGRKANEGGGEEERRGGGEERATVVNQISSSHGPTKRWFTNVYENVSCL